LSWIFVDEGNIDYMNDVDVGYVSRAEVTTKNKTGTIALAAVACVILFVVLFVNNFLTVFLIASVFAAANLALRIYKAYVDFPMEFEISTFATVAITMGFGFNAGIFTAIWVGFWGDVYTGATVYTPITILSYIFAAFLATLFPTSFFIGAGIIISLIITGASYILYRITQSFLPFENAMYSITNFVGNVYFFIAFAWIAKLIF
jgi:hypothetical protein